MRKGERFYREVFFSQNGPGPYVCQYCFEEVDFLIVLVHHANHDEDDHAVENLVAMHRGCHTKHHSKGRTTGVVHSEETKRKMSEGQKIAWQKRRGK